MARFVARRLVPYVVLLPLLLLVGCGGDDDALPSARLRVEANAATSSSLVGPLGVTLEVPDGASTTEVTIVMTALTGRRNAPAGTVQVFTPIRLGPEGQTFEKPLEVSFPIEPSSLPAGSTIDDVVVLRAPQDGDVFVPLPTRRSGNAVIAQTEHFSDFVPVVVQAADGGGVFGGCLDAMCLGGETCSSCPADCGLCLAPDDVAPPMLVQVTPLDGSSSVPSDAVVTLIFDEALLASSVTSANVVLRDATAVVPATVSLNGSQVTIAPAGRLAPETAYTVDVSGLRDVVGNVMPAPYSFGFVTAARAMLLVLLPSQGANAVPQAAEITWQFDADPRLPTLSAPSADGACTGSVEVSIDGFASCLGGAIALDTLTHTVRFLPTEPMPGGSTVRARFTAAAEDGGGFSLDVIGERSFVVEPDLAPPSVVRVSPADLSTNVPGSTLVEVEFDEPIDVASVHAATFEVSDGETVVSGVTTVNGRVIHFVPDVPLSAASSFTISVGAVRDRANNPHAGSSTIFDTQSGTVRVGGVPAFNGVGVHPRQDLVIQLSRSVVPATITMQATDGPCTGSIWLTTDGGTTCLGGSVQVAGATDTLVVRATSDMLLGVYYDVRVDPTVARDIADAGFHPSLNVLLSFRVSPTNDFGWVISSHSSLVNPGVGLSGADLLCDPSGAGTRKAFMMSSTRYACTTPNCSTGDESADWVLDPATTYVNAAGDLLFVTDATRPIYTNWPMATFYSSSNINFLWGGTVDWRHANALDCNGWTSNFAFDTYSVGYELSQTSGFIDGGTLSCDSARSLLCVQQVPASTPATH